MEYRLATKIVKSYHFHNMDKPGGQQIRLNNPDPKMNSGLCIAGQASWDAHMPF